VRISGGGALQCHQCLSDPKNWVHSYPRGEKGWPKAPFTNLQHRIPLVVQARGVTLKAEPDGRMFPVADLSETSSIYFMDYAERTGIFIQTNTEITAVRKDPINLFAELRMQNLEGGFLLSLQREAIPNSFKSITILWPFFFGTGGFASLFTRFNVPHHPVAN